MINLATNIAVSLALATLTLAPNSAPCFGQAPEEGHEYLGGLRASQELVLSPIAAGRLVEFDLVLGQRVSKGQTVGTLDQEQFQSETAAAATEVQIALAEAKNDVDLRYAETLQRVNDKVYRKSLEANERFKKTISATEIDRLRLEAERARLSAEQAVMQQEQRNLNVALKKDLLEIAKIRLQNRLIVSSVDGTVVELFLKAGEYANAGQPVARIINMDRLKVSSQASIEDLMPNRVAEDAIFVVEIDGEKREFPARVTFASPEINWARKTFLVEAEVQNQDRELFAGQFGRLILKEKTQ
jgi:multidrug efflux pump subunit AcrA (membrane-fusion protein)